jgi:hypothetical protein
LKYYYLDNENKRELGLTALRKIQKGDLVALYPDGERIAPEVHYIRQSDEPTCHLEANEVFASRDIEPETELTLNFKK